MLAHKVCKTGIILFTVFFHLGWAISTGRAQQPGETNVIWTSSGVGPSNAADGKPEDSSTQSKPEKAPSKEPTGAASADKGPDPAVVSAGMAAFEQSCTTCHNAARSLERTKDLAGWRATVRRMAAKRGAEIASGEMEPIAVYLASRNSTGTSAGATADKDKAGAAATSNDASTVSAFATLSPQWRGGNDHLQNSGFAPLAWVGGSWQSKIVSARVTVCVSCHGVQEQTFLNRVDLVEAAVRLDLSQFVEPYCRGMKASIDAGRFVVPFGAFSSQTNPGLYRTVSTPLIFNMGQRVFNQDLGVPVLPMPYSNTGIDFNLDVPLGNCGTGPITVSIDNYLINGLAGSSNGVDWLQSRDLLDNNNRVGYGARVSVGDPYIRLGASYMSGRFDSPSDPSVPNGPLDYRIYGFDVQAHYKRLFRCQVEYARRDSDRVGTQANGTDVFSERVNGYYLEAEVRPWEECRVSLLARQDFLRTNSELPPPVSTLPTGTFNVERFTVGINIELWQQSLLMFDYERWLIPEPSHVANVFGVRYTVSF
jgi:hypothetical protein